MAGFFSDILWLSIYILLWLASLFYFWKKEKRFSANILVLLSYLGYSIISLIYYIVSYPEYRGLTLFPFVFLFIMVLIALRPLSKHCSRDGIEIVEPNKKAFRLFLIIWAACSIFTILHSLPSMREGIMRILIDSSGGLDLYNDNQDGYSELGNGTSLANLPILFSNVFADIGILSTFYYLRFKHINKVYAILLICAVFSPLFRSIAISQRGPAVDNIFKIAITYILMRPYYGERIKRVAGVIGFSIISFFLIAMTAITISRFGQTSSESALSSVYAYSGMQNLNFNKYAFDNNGLRYGDRVAPMFKSFLGFDNVPKNFMDRRSKYPHLKINDEVFIGFVGDFLLDFGPIVSFFLFCFFSTFFCKKTIPKKKSISFQQLLLVQFSAFVCMCGGMKLFSYADTGNLRIIALFLSYMYFKFTDRKRYTNSKKQHKSKWKLTTLYLQ